MTEGITRREVLCGATGAAVMLGLGGTARYAFGNALLVRPPGGQDEEHLLATCIKCSRCRSVCPLSVISTAGIESGLTNARTPKMDFRKGHYTFPEGFRIESDSDTDVGTRPASTEDGLNILAHSGGSNYCNFCNLCIDNCPTGALRPFDPLVQWIGEAVIVSERCIAYDKKGGCRKCVDYCPTSAISLDENECPVIDLALCNGCGVCENICPTDTYRTYKGNNRRGVNVMATSKERSS
jgi:ferredoxin-type protein NapG